MNMETWQNSLKCTLKWSICFAIKYVNIQIKHSFIGQMVQ
jgi:hypothetical protein